MATNVQMPIDNAGIGDAIAIKNNTTGEDKSHFICVVGSTVDATAPSGYTWYGTVYGRERGGLMVQAITYFNEQWANTTGNITIGITSSSHPNVFSTITSEGGKMRNGFTNDNQPSFVAMNVKQLLYRIDVSENSSKALHPRSPYYGYGTYPMNKANFDLDANGAKTIYGTYENYISQLFPIMKGSESGVFGKRCGKKNTKELATTNAGNYSFPAAQKCYNLKVAHENANHWWLPDMYELAVMMSDSSYERWKYAHGTIYGHIDKDYMRWASILNSFNGGWAYNHIGFSGTYFLSEKKIVCPVTLIPL